MKITLIVLLLSVWGWAKEHYARVEPYRIVLLSSNVSGQVLFADEDRLGSVLGEEPFLEIDDELDVKELASVERKVALLQSVLTLNEEMTRNYDRMLERKTDNFERINALKIKSGVEKDREFYDLAATQNQALATRKEMENLRVQINDLTLRRAQLQKVLRDKHLAAAGLVLYDLKVKRGQYVNPATPLAELADVSRGKLTLFLSAEELEGIGAKTIYLEGEKTDYRIDRRYAIADAQHLSSYRVEIIVAAPARFSQLMKVEFKDE